MQTVSGVSTAEPPSPGGADDEGRPAYSPPGTTSGTWWAVLAAAAAAASVAIGVVDRPEAGLAFGLIAGLPLLAVRAPLETALLLVLTGWVPLETLFGNEKDLLISNGVNVSGARLIGGSLGLTLALWLLRDQLGAARSWPSPLRIGIALYVAMVAWSGLTLAWSPDPIEGLRGVTKLAFPLLAFGVIAANPRRLAPRRLLVLVAWTLVAAVVAATLFGVLGTIDRSILPTDESGSVADWYGWAGWTTFALFASIAGVALLALGEHGFFRAGLPVGMLAIIQIPLTLIRISLGGLAAALALMFAIGGRRRWLALTAVVPILVLFTFPPLVEQNVYNYSTSPPPAEQRTDGAGGNESGEGAAETSLGAIGEVVSDPLNLPSFIKLQGRENLWEQALGLMGGADWLIGTGFGHWVHLNEGVSGSGALHGEAVHLLFETGLIGLSLFVAAFALLLLALARQARESAPGSASAASATAAIGVLAVYLIAGLTDNTLDYYTVGATGWAVIAVATVCRVERGAPGGDRQPGQST